MTLTNTGGTAYSTWTLKWTFPGDQQITQMWNATSAQSGEQVTANAESYNAALAPNSSVTIGFTGSFTNSNASPTAFTVNGTACT